MADILEQINNSSYSELLSKIDNLEHLLQDKEVFIDNLIGRAGTQESYILAKEEESQNINDELFKQQQRTALLDESILQRDNSIVQLESNFMQTLEILTNKQQSDQSVTNLLDRFEELRTKLSKRDKVAQALANITDENYKLRSEHVNEIIGLDDKNSALNSRISSLTNEVISRNNQVEQLTREVLNLNVRITQREDVVHGLTKEVGELNSQISVQHKWGQRALQKIHQLEKEVNNIKRSSSWKITAPFRKVSLGAKRAGRILSHVLLAPYRTITLLGWRYSPRLFHRIYHQPFVQLILDFPVKKIRPILVVKNRLSSDSSNLIRATEHAIIGSRNLTQKVSTWQIGDRIDGPEG